MPPAQSASTIISGVYPGIDFTSGAMPAAVMMATVAEPCASWVTYVNDGRNPARTRSEVIPLAL